MRQRRHGTQVPPPCAPCPACPPCPTCLCASTMFAISIMLRWSRQNFKEFRSTKTQMATKTSEKSFGILSVGILCVGILSAHLCSACVPFNCTEPSYCCWMKMSQYLDFRNHKKNLQKFHLFIIILLSTIQIEERTDPKQLFCITKTLGVMSVKGAALLNLDHWLLISETP